MAANIYHSLELTKDIHHSLKDIKTKIAPENTEAIFIFNTLTILNFIFQEEDFVLGLGYHKSLSDQGLIPF